MSSDDITIKVNPSPAEIAHQICADLAHDRPTLGIHMTDEHILKLVGDWGKRGDMLLKLQDMVKQSISRQQDLVAEISRLMEGGDNE